MPQSQLCENMMSSTKLEVYNTSQCRQRRTEPWSQATLTKIWWSLAAWFLRYGNGQTNQHRNKQIYRQTDILIKILCTPPRGKAVMQHKTPNKHMVKNNTVYYYIGHIAHADPSMDQSWALRSSVAPLPRDWNHKSGRMYQTWLRTVESDVAPLNIGLATAYHWAQNWQAWKSLVEMAMSTGQAKWWWW